MTYEKELSWLERVESLANQVAAQEKCIIYDIEFVGAGQGRTLRIYIDKGEDLISLDDCSNVSKGLNALLDAEEDLIPGGTYYLEVSTPGIERLLKRPWHFEKVVGKKIWVKALKSLENAGVTDSRWKNAKTIESTLHSADESGIKFLINDLEIVVPYEMIDKAKLVFEMSKGTKK